MEPIFTDKQLNNMSREDLISLMKIVQEQTKKKDTEIQLLKDKQKELEFLNAMLSDRLTLAQRKQFGASSEKYAEGYEQMNLFNEAEASADAETEELFEEIRQSWKELPKVLTRAAMAKCLSRLPITFKTSDEAQAYIRNSLECCTDEIEKEACVRMLRSIME